RTPAPGNRDDVNIVFDSVPIWKISRSSLGLKILTWCYWSVPSLARDSGPEGRSGNFPRGCRYYSKPNFESVYRSILFKFSFAMHRLTAQPSRGLTLPTRPPALGPRQPLRTTVAPFTTTSTRMRSGSSYNGGLRMNALFPRQPRYGNINANTSSIIQHL